MDFSLIFASLLEVIGGIVFIYGSFLVCHCLVNMLSYSSKPVPKPKPKPDPFPPYSREELEAHCRKIGLSPRMQQVEATKAYGFAPPNAYERYPGNY